MTTQMSDLISQQEPQRLATGFIFTEGPVWHPDGYLLFTDIPMDVINRWTPDGGVEPYVRSTGCANGLTYDRQGRLVACEHTGRRVSRLSDDHRLMPLAESYQGKRLNSPNDIVVDSRGGVCFTDPLFGAFGVPVEAGELGFFGVYRIDPDGSLTLLTDDCAGPNGLAFSPDESILYIADSRSRHIRAFDMQPDGSLTNDRVFIDMNVETPGAPDGMKVDVEGNIYSTGPGGVWVVDPNGRHLGTVAIPEQAANLAFGGPDNRTIYVTARTSLYSIQGKVPGVKALP